MSSDDDRLPDDRVEQLYAGVQGTLFTPAQLKRARWLAWWDLYFAEDGANVPYHRWTRAAFFQRMALKRYVWVRECWQSSTRRELVVNAGLLFVFGTLCAVVNAVIRQTPPTLGDILVRGPIALLVCVAAWDLRFYYRDPFYMADDDDRPSHYSVAALLFPVAIHAPVLVRPVLLLLWRFVSFQAIKRLLPWAARRPWTTRYVMYESWGVRHVRPEFFACVDAAVALVVMGVATSFPWTATPLSVALPSVS